MKSKFFKHVSKEDHVAKKLARKQKMYANPEKRYIEYKASARKRGLSFTLDMNIARVLFQSVCFYCGISTQSRGIDRLDNDVGYTDDNCVAACWECNKAKGTMNYVNFVEMCKRVGKEWNHR